MTGQYETVDAFEHDVLKLFRNVEVCGVIKLFTFLALQCDEGSFRIGLCLSGKTYCV